MSALLYHRNLVADLTPSSLFNNRLDKDPAPTEDILVDVPGGANIAAYGFGDEVGIVSPAQFAAVYIEVLEGSTDVTIHVRLQRVSSGGVFQAESIEYEVPGTSGRAWIVNYSNPSLGTWAPTDRLRVSYRFVNDSGQQRSINLRLNGETARVYTPYTPEDRWGGASANVDTRASVGDPDHYGPIGVATWSPTEGKYGTCFYSRDLGLSWFLARGTEYSSAGDHPIAADYWEGIPQYLLGSTGYIRFVGHDPHGFSSSRVKGSRLPDHNGSNLRPWNWTTGVVNILVANDLYSAGFSDPRFGGNDFSLYMGGNATVNGVDIGDRKVVGVAFSPSLPLWVGVVDGGTSYITNPGGGSSGPDYRDLPDWTSRNRNGGQWNCICYSVELEMFVVGCTDGTIETSTTGTSWTVRDQPSLSSGWSRNAVRWIPSISIKPGAKGSDTGEVIPGRFVMVGNGGSMIYSYDGIIWHRATNYTSTSMNRLDYIPDHKLVVAGGQDGYMRRSYDLGETWEESTRLPQGSIVNADREYTTELTTTYIDKVGNTRHVRGLVWRPDMTDLKRSFFIVSGPRPPQPNLVNATQTSIQISWEDIGASDYDVRRSVVTKEGEYSWTTVDSGLPAGSSSHESLSLAPGTAYAFAVRGGGGLWSVPLITQTLIDAVAPTTAPTLYLKRDKFRVIVYGSWKSWANPADTALLGILEGFGFEAVKFDKNEFLDLATPVTGSNVTNQYDLLILAKTMSSSTNYSTGFEWSYTAMDADVREPNTDTGWVGIDTLSRNMPTLIVDRWIARFFGMADASFAGRGTSIFREDGFSFSEKYPLEFDIYTQSTSLQRLSRTPPGAQGLSARFAPEAINYGSIMSVQQTSGSKRVFYGAHRFDFANNWNKILLREAIGLAVD